MHRASHRRLLDDLITPTDGPCEVRATGLLDHFGSLYALVNARRSELVAAGLSPAAARRIGQARRLAVAMLGRRRGRRLRCTRDVAAMVPHLGVSPVEELWVIPVDGTHRALACTRIARGNAASCAVSVAEVFGPALRHRARGVFVVHNHPSGDPTASHHDLVFTETLRIAGKMLQIELIDHVVVAGQRFASIVRRRRGALPVGPDRRGLGVSGS